MYGLVDAGVHIANTGNGSQTNLASGIADGSRLGFKGSEDLGGGYKAVFNLEMRFETDTGASGNGYPTADIGTALTTGLPATIAAALVPSLQPNRIINADSALFDRTSIVGLITPVGAFLLGRQYTPGYEVLAMADTFEAGTAGGWGNIAGGTGGFATTGVAIRTNSALQYRLQFPSGFGASLMYAISDTESASSRDGVGSLNYSKRFWGGNVRYQANGVNVGLAYNTEDDQTGNKSLSSWTLGGSYVLGSAKVFASYHRMRNDNSVLTDAVEDALAERAPLLPSAQRTIIANTVGQNGRLDADSYTLGMHYSVGSGRVMAAVSHTEDNLPTDAKATLYAVGYNWHSPGRTDTFDRYDWTIGGV
jgi:predicted porin